MTQALALDIARDAIELAVLLAGPLLGVALSVGLAVSIVQAVTSIQEQTLSFVPKLFAVAGTFLLLLSWMLEKALQFTAELILSLPSLAG